MPMGYERRGGYGGGANRFGPKPVEEGKEYDVDIKEISRRGEGIARVEGLVVFVPNTKPGDHIKIKITRVSNRFASGEVVQYVRRGIFLLPQSPFSCFMVTKDSSP